MIFLTVGSQKFQFDRLLQAVDKLIASDVINDEIYAQTGYSSYCPKNYRTNAFLDRESYLAAIENSVLVICHGGTGSIISALKSNKKVIAVPRLARYGEHVDDHQQQIIKLFADFNLICPCSDVANLEKAYRTCLQSVYSKYSPSNVSFCNDLDAYLQTIFNEV